MRNDKGSAVVMVLLILGVLSLLGAGLMVQSRYDIKYNRAQTNYDKMLNLADGAAKVALFGVTYQTPGAYSGEAALVVIDSKSPTNLGVWQAQAWYLGQTMHPMDMAGWELGQGYHAQYWVGQGSGSKADLGSESALSVIQVGGVKFAK